MSEQVLQIQHGLGGAKESRARTLVSLDCGPRGGSAKCSGLGASTSRWLCWYSDEFLHAGGGGWWGGTDLSGLRPLCDLWQVTVSLCDLFSSPVIKEANKSAYVSGRGFKD